MASYYKNQSTNLIVLLMMKLKLRSEFLKAININLTYKNEFINSPIVLNIRFYSILSSNKNCINAAG